MINNNPRNTHSDRSTYERGGVNNGRVNSGNYSVNQNGGVGINMGGGTIIGADGNVDIQIPAITFNADGSMSTNYGLG